VDKFIYFMIIMEHIGTSKVKMNVKNLYICINTTSNWQSYLHSRGKELLASTCLSALPHATSGLRLNEWPSNLIMGGLLWRSVDKNMVKSKSYVRYFTWRPQEVLLLPETLGLHKVLFLPERVSESPSVRPSVSSSVCLPVTARFALQGFL
jgi:hypothetical protein